MLFRSIESARPAESASPVLKATVTTTGGGAARGAWPEDDPRVGRAAKLLAGRHAPPSVLVDGHGSVVYFIGDCSRYLTLPAGTPDLSLFAMARPNLIKPLHDALRTVAVELRPTTVRCDTGSDGQGALVDLIIEPLAEPSDDEPSQIGRAHV